MFPQIPRFAPQTGILRWSSLRTYRYDDYFGECAQHHCFALLAGGGRYNSKISEIPVTEISKGTGNFEIFIYF